MYQVSRTFAVWIDLILNDDIIGKKQKIRYLHNKGIDFTTWDISFNHSFKMTPSMKKKEVQQRLNYWLLVTVAIGLTCNVFDTALAAAIANVALLEPTLSKLYVNDVALVSLEFTIELALPRLLLLEGAISCAAFVANVERSLSAFTRLSTWLSRVCFLSASKE